MEIPVRYKPKRDYPNTDFILEIPNALPKDEAVRLKNLAIFGELNMHTRGAKSFGVSALFDTYLITNENDTIYPILEKIWLDFSQSIDTKLSFIEPYELKMYKIGNHFNTHVDTYINLKEKLIRKFTMVVQLSDIDEYEGGDLIIDDYVSSRNIGTAILFPANIPHRVTEIIKNSRFSLIGHGWGVY